MEKFSTTYAIASCNREHGVIQNAMLEKISFALKSKKKIYIRVVYMSLSNDYQQAVICQVFQFEPSQNLKLFS